MIPSPRQQQKDLSGIYGVSAGKKLSEEGAVVMDMMSELDLPLHKDASLRAMLLELDSYKNMPRKYFSALSDVLVYAMKSNDPEDRAKANS